ncbi:hypothetical protein CY34DRAFT_69217, partial [Suillus luteus UH-Slu-Lm8-n1]
LRVVRMSCGLNFLLSINSHDLMVIEADAQLTNPLLVDWLQILAKQQCSFVFNAKQPVDNYYIR